MNREIKFRAWDKRHNEMYDWETIKAEFTMKDFEHEDLVWLQYTGLKDGAGYEIYEGDILIEYPHQNLHEVIWDEYGLFLFNPVGASGEAVDYYGFEETAASLSFVQSNIYKNPELLAGDKN